MWTGNEATLHGPVRDSLLSYIHILSLKGLVSITCGINTGLLALLVLVACTSSFRNECLTEEVDKYPAEILQFTKLLVFPTVRFEH